MMLIRNLFISNSNAAGRQVNRSRWSAMAMCTLASIALAQGASAQTYMVLSLPDDIGKLPCRAFQKSGDGWNIVGTIITAGGSKLSGGGFAAGSREAAAIEKSCGERPDKPDSR